VGGPLLISNPNVDSFSHGIQGSSPPLFSPCNFDTSNADLDDDVIFLDEFNTIPKIDLPTISCKLIVKKNNYDASRIFLNS
jgi:hypothetical protein